MVLANKYLLTLANAQSKIPLQDKVWVVAVGLHPQWHMGLIDDDVELHFLLHPAAHDWDDIKQSSA